MSYTPAPRPAEARDLLYFTTPALWPTWPFLPVIRPREGGYDCGLLFDARQAMDLTGYSATVFLGNLFCLPPTLDDFLELPREVFDTPEELAAAGWRVDWASCQDKGEHTMSELFDAVAARLKAIFTARAALELEAELILGHIERKAALLRRADELDREGLGELAAELRNHAGRLDPRRPAEAVPPALPAPAPGGQVALTLPETLPKDDGDLTAPPGPAPRRKAR